MSRPLATQQKAAAHFQVTDKTIPNWITNGLITGYRMPGARAIRVDIDEIERVMRSIPTTVARPGTKAFGPKARIRNVVLAEPAAAALTEQGGQPCPALRDVPPALRSAPPRAPVLLGGLLPRRAAPRRGPSVRRGRR